MVNEVIDNNNLNNQKILITGSAGVLGTALLSRMNGINSSHILCPNRQEMNLLDEKAVNDYLQHHQPTIIIHLASLVYGLAGNMANQMQSLSNNTIINHILFKSVYDLQKNNLLHIKKIFFAGTVASYPFPYPNMPLQEKDFFQGVPHSGEFGYALAKKHAYGYLEILQKEFSIDYVYGILTNLYGENDRFDVQNGHVIPSLIAKAYRASIQKSKLEVWGDGSATRDFMYTQDAARAILFLLNTKFTGLINISSYQETNIKTLAKTIAHIAGIEELVFLSDKPTGIPMRLVNNLKLIELGFELEFSLKEALSATYNWYVNHQNKIRI